MSRRIEILAVEGMPEAVAGDDIAAMIAERVVVIDGDIVVVTQKIVSKAEGRLIRLDGDAAARAEQRRAWIEKETVRVVARRGDLIVAETRHGFVCANAGVDESNVAPGWICLLPNDPDASARAIRSRFAEITGADVGVVVSDTFGRPWRVGQTNVAIGAAGIATVNDLIGTADALGNELHATQIAVADEIAGAAELVMGKADRIPVAIVRGVDAAGDGSARDLIRMEADDLFRRGSID